MFLSVERLREILDTVEYKDGWGFKVWQHPYEGPYVTIRVEVPNAYDRNDDTVLNIHSPLPPMRRVWQFEDWLLWRVSRIEVHEAAEFLTVNGERVRDPHKEEVHA